MDLRHRIKKAHTLHHVNVLGFFGPARSKPWIESCRVSKMEIERIVKIMLFSSIKLCNNHQNRLASRMTAYYFFSQGSYVRGNKYGNVLPFPAIANGMYQSRNASIKLTLEASRWFRQFQLPPDNCTSTGLCLIENYSHLTLRCR